MVALPNSLQRDLLLLSIVAAASRFIPVPILDGVVKTQANRLAVSRALTHAGRHVAVSSVSPLYSTGHPLTFLLTMPLKLILYPIRKLVKLVSTARGVPYDLMETLLLGRAVFALAKQGVFSSEDPVQLELEARLGRAAFDEALKSSRFKVMSAALGDVLSQMKHLGESAESLMRQILERVNTNGDSDTPLTANEALEDELQAASEVMSSSEVLAELAAFDQNFKDAWAKQSP